MNRIGDRHKGPNRPSGAQKRKLSKEKSSKNEQILSKTRHITAFLQKPTTTTSTVTMDDCQISGSSDPGVVVSEQRPLQQLPQSAGSHAVTVNETDILRDTESDNVNNNITIENTVAGEIVEDIGLWPEHLTQEVINYWAKNGCDSLQHCDKKVLQQHSVCQRIKSNVKIKKSDFVRKCSVSLFERRNRNGEILKRTWLCFSPSTGKVYCFVCKLMAVKNKHLSHDGFADWKNANKRFVEHEQCTDHLNAVIALLYRSKELGRIDSELAEQVQQQISYWRQLLKRVISVIRFACERGLPLRGDNEILGSVSNGNYLGLLELLSEYDDFLKQHMQKHGNRGTGHINYLSSTICEELVKLMGQRVIEEIVSRIQISRYYSVSLDSTSDESHVDQLTLVIRYMENEKPVERFLTFMPNQGHKAQEMFEGLMNFLNMHEIDIRNCRGQSYDNASAMSGKYNGLQAKVIEQSPLAAWVPCAAHSLNLVALAAAESCNAAAAFFSFLEDLYVFFTASTRRYEILTTCLSRSGGQTCVPKRISTTRWSCRANATKALTLGYREIDNALISIANNSEELAEVRCKANGIHARMSLLETGIYVFVWNEILERVNACSKYLQNPNLDLNTALATVKSLKRFVESKRDCFTEFEKKGADLCGTALYSQTVSRTRQQNVRLIPLDYGRAPEAVLSASEKFRIDNFLPIIDQFTAELTKRLASYEILCSRFGFLCRLESCSDEEIQNSAKKIVEVYGDDLDESLGNELIQFCDFVKLFKDETGKSNLNTSQEQFMYQLILDKGVKSSFPNVEILLRMYLVLMVTNCTAERSFSKMKIIKSRLRTSMTHERLSHLAMLSIESDILYQVNFNQIIDDFANKKVRKVAIGPQI